MRNRIAKLLEKDIQRMIMQYLVSRGAFPIRVNSMAVAGTHKGKKRFIRSNSEDGCSDILCCYRGLFLALEVKRPGARAKKTGKEASDNQLAFLEKVRRADGVAEVVTSVEDVELILETLDKEMEQNNE